jgi:hypothetical protein
VEVFNVWFVRVDIDCFDWGVVVVGGAKPAELVELGGVTEKTTAVFDRVDRLGVGGSGDAAVDMWGAGASLVVVSDAPTVSSWDFSRTEAGTSIVMVSKATTVSSWDIDVEEGDPSPLNPYCKGG